MKYVLNQILLTIKAHWKILVLMCVLFALACIAPAAHGAPRTAEQKMESLENTWWDCEAQAQFGIVGMGEAGMCSQVFEELKLRKFGGDFNKFMEWWRVERGLAMAKRIMKQQ